MDRAKAFASRAPLEAWEPDDAPTAFSDTMAAAFALTRREELSNSSARAWRGKFEERAAVVEQLGGDRRLAEAYADIQHLDELRAAAQQGPVEDSPYWKFLRSWEQDAWRYMRTLEERHPGEVLDDMALFEAFVGEAATAREEEHFAMQRGSGVAGFLGTAGAIFTDPLILGTLPFGATYGAGRTVLGAAGRAALAEGAIGFAVEIPIQAEVFRFKQEIDSPWTFKDSAINVLSAAGGGIVLGGTIGGGVQATRNALRSYRAARDAGKVVETPQLAAADQILESTLELHQQNPLRPPDGEPARPGATASAERAHEQAFEVARLQHEAGRPVDVANIIEGLEPSDPVSQVITRSQDPAQLVDIDPAAVQIDARTFQFKSGSDGAGVTDALAGVQRFDRRLAGVALIWERADGQRFIADGHQRLALARRAIAAGQDPAEVRLNGFLLREEDGISAIDARRMAAAKNMAEGTGSALDAAKILRDVGPAGELLLPPLPPRSALIRQARGLAGLSEENFLSVVNGAIDARYGALVGEASADPKLQEAMIEVLRKTQPANETQARSIVAQVKTAGTETIVTEDLFGAQAVTESLYLERAQVLDAALREARKDQQVFGRLVSNEGRIQEAGANRLDRAANLERIQEAADATTQITALANSKGPLSDALTEAARSIKAGTKPAAAADAFLKAARREILAGHRRGREAGRAGPGAPAAEPPRLEPRIGEPLRITDLPPDQRPLAHQALLAKQAKRSLDEIYRAAETHQAELGRLAKEISAEFGEDVVVSDPGIKKKATAAEKLSRKGKAAGELTDVVRLGFLVRTPELAAEMIRRLGRRLEIVDEGVTVTGMGYVDHKALVRFADGIVAEVQLWEPAIAAAKFGEGHRLYESVRSISPEDVARDPALAARVDAANAASKELYARALAAGSPEWRRVAMMQLPDDMRLRVQAIMEEGGGTTGAAGNVSRKALRESSEPDSRISTGEIRDQVSEPVATNRPSSPPAEVSRTTAGRHSQLKNRSAIDAPPRSIVRQVDDARSAHPDASRTGTVPDIEYETVMARYQDLVEQQGELARVASEVDGQLEVRSARAAIEQLDALEDTLERVRLCNTAKRTAA